MDFQGFAYYHRVGLPPHYDLAADRSIATSRVPDCKVRLHRHFQRDWIPRWMELDALLPRHVVRLDWNGRCWTYRTSPLLDPDVQRLTVRSNRLRSCQLEENVDIGRAEEEHEQQWLFDERQYSDPGGHSG